MSDERRDAAPEGSARVKVTDRRRFTQEGEAVLDPAASPEPEAGPGDAPSPQGAPAAEVRDPRLAEQAARIDELSRAYAALLEDNKAFRQRQERERTRLLESERAGLAQALLEAADDLERALAAVSGAGDGGGEALRGLVEGVRLSLGGLQKRISDLGAVRISVVGQPFDPRVAEAIDAVPVADAAQDGRVLQEVRSGWRIGERILRPARVRVGRIARA